MKEHNVNENQTKILTFNNLIEQNPELTEKMNQLNDEIMEEIDPATKKSKRISLFFLKIYKKLI